MKLGVERRDGYWELILEDAGGSGAGSGQESVAGLARELEGAAARPGFLLWNLSGAVELGPETFSWMLGASALFRLQGTRVFVAGLPDQVSAYLGQLGMRSSSGRDVLPVTAGEPPPAGGVRVIELYRWRWGGKREERVGGPPSLGEILLELGVLSREQLDDALTLQRHEKSRGRLGNLLIRMGLVSDEQIFAALEEQYRRGLQRLPSSASDWKGQARETRESLLGNVLLSLGILSSEGLDTALQEQWGTGGRETLGAVLIRMGLVTRPQLFRALERQDELKAKMRRATGPLPARVPGT